MATVARIPLSGSTHGRGIKVVATAAGSATTIHTAQASTTNVDVVTLYAHNSSGSAVNLTLTWGGTTDPDDLIRLSVPAASGLTVLVPDMVLRNGLVIGAFAGTANVLTIHGYVNRVA